MLAYLVFQSRGENESRNALHTIRFIQVAIDLVETFVARLDLHVIRVPLLKRSEMAFEAHERSSICFTLKGRFRHEVLIDT